MKIGSVKLRNNLVLAPMAGISDLPFRLMAVDHGCGLVVSEMVSAKGLLMGGEKTRDLLGTSPGEKPLAVQIFGSEPGVMAEAAVIVEEMGADILDINMGCPVKKVVGSGAGSALLKDLKNTESILKRVKERITIPLTIKIRSGWDHSSIAVFEVLKVAEANGVDAVTIHPRTRSQGFSGRADWNLIGKIKERAKITVIGNGDVREAKDVKRMLDLTGCDGVMIGRGAMGNPWIFGQGLSYLGSGRHNIPTMKEKRMAALKHLGLVLERYGSTTGIKIFRKHLSCYARGIAGASSFRRRINGSLTPGEVEDLIVGFFSPVRDDEGARQIDTGNVDAKPIILSDMT